MTLTMRKVLRALLFTAVVGGSVVAVWWFTRKPAAPAPVAAAPDPHAGMDMSGTSPEAPPVMLTADAARRIGVTYATAALAPFHEDVRTVGTVAYDETRVKTISPKIDGWVERLDVAFTGQPVEVGTPLLSIYSPMLVTAQQELLLAKKLTSSVGSSAEAVQNAEALVAAARRRLRSWDIPDDEIAQVERTGEVLRTVTLRAPVRGVVVRLDVRSGQRVMAGDVLYQIADLDAVWLEGEVFERDLATVRLGDHVTADFAALPGQPREGQVTFVDPVLNTDTRTVRVRVNLSNRGLALKPGMYATLQIHGVWGTALQVPRSALLFTGQRALVFVRDAQGMLVPREVVTGRMDADHVVIMSGLVAGETVVSSATFLVDAESNLGSILGGMASMPGMKHDGR
jgi:Cu(I)/Ag(I) efflux system membrane fusion protein